MKIPNISIIGLGRLGSALAEAFAEARLPLYSVFTRSSKKVPYAIADSESFPAEKEELGKLVFITVKDQAIREVSRHLAELDTDFSGYTFIHCSGSETAGLLTPLQQKNAKIAAFHPLQTFNPQSGSRDFKGIYFSMQGDDATFPLLREVAGKLGAEAFEVTPEQKERLHSAGVMASNYLITLLDAAVKAGAGAGIGDQQVKKVLLPLVQTTITNAREGSFEEILSGPLMRGDLETVEKHLRLLQDQPQLLKLYKALGNQTLEIAAVSGDLTVGQVENMRQALNS